MKLHKSKTVSFVFLRWEELAKGTEEGKCYYKDTASSSSWHLS